MLGGCQAECCALVGVGDKEIFLLVLVIYGVTNLPVLTMYFASAFIRFDCAIILRRSRLLCPMALARSLLCLVYAVHSKRKCDIVSSWTSSSALHFWQMLVSDLLIL